MKINANKFSSTLADFITLGQQQDVSGLLAGLRIILLSSLYWEMNTDSAIMPRRNPDTYLCIPTKGRMHVDAAGEQCMIGPGEVLITSRNQLTSAMRETSDPKLALFALHAHVHRPGLPPDAPLFQSSLFRLQYPEYWFGQLRVLTSLLGHDQAAGQSLGRGLLRLMLVEALRTGSSLALRTEDMDPRIDRALQWMSEHLADSFRVEQVAEVVGLGGTQFRLLFKQVHQRTPSAMMTELRLKHAAELLATTDLPIKQIALRCGFTRVQYMYDRFKREYGMTPNHYRHAFAEQ